MSDFRFKALGRDNIQRDKKLIIGENHSETGTAKRLFGFKLPASQRLYHKLNTFIHKIAAAKVRD
jgi:hypothetical protein